MSKQLMDIVLPRLARPLERHLERFKFGEISEQQFTRKFEALLHRQHTWLAERGISDAHAAVTIHAALLILSESGLRTEAEESGVPLEAVEFKAIREAAADVARNYGVDERKVIRVMSRIVARYSN